MRPLSSRPRRFLSFSLAVAVLLGVCAAPVAAAPPKPAPAKDDGSRVWSMRPATPDGKPDNRSHFTLQATPGTEVRDKVLITNLSKVTVTFAIYGTDAFNTTTGLFDLLAADKKPTDLGAWLGFPSRSVTIRAGQSLAVPFVVEVPASATPGDHAGGVVVSLAGPGGGPGVNVDSRVAIRVYLRVPGNLRPRLAVGPVKVAYHGVSSPFGRGSATITYTVTNPGNIRLRSGQKITVSGPFGNTLATLTPTDLPELLPGQTATFTQTLRHVFPALALTATVALTPYPDPAQPVGQAVPAASGRGYAWVMPWLLLLVAVIIAAGLAAMWWRRRRRMLARLDSAMAVAREETLKEARKTASAAAK